MPALRHGRIVKIFLSSPFGGMEEEREELTRRYFPQIQHLCQALGLQFAAVDMRWGITTEASDNFQVIDICLREIDRSDMFIGFFGQRYGWHGAEDKMLQENFDNAVGRYPWLEKFRDKSVTELEFLHGFLNEPGKLPAALFFRDKLYDDMVREEGVKKGDKKQVFKYSPESELSTSLMDNLKDRVWDEREKSLGVYMDYKTPAEGVQYFDIPMQAMTMIHNEYKLLDCVTGKLQEGGKDDGERATYMSAAKIMFELIMSHLKDNILVHLDDRKVSKNEEILRQHDAFLSSRCNIYVDGEKYLQQLNHILETGEKKHVLVTGSAGIGKSALLCNWLSGLRKNTSDYIVFYHFTGYAESSTDVNCLLSRMVDDLMKQYDCLVPSGSPAFTWDTPVGEPDEVTRNIVQQLVWLSNKICALGKIVVIVIDGLDKLKVMGKIKKVLFWLPSNFPPNCMIVLSTVTTDKQRIEEIQSRNYDFMQIEPLTNEAKSEMLVATLKESGKELSPPQVEKIVSAEMTRLPLFLKITLSELVSFGYFRLLDKKIEALISSKSVEDLFTAVLARLEEDYNVTDYTGNLVEEVMCSVCLSHQGMSEMELKEIYNIPDHVWVPLYFAIEKLTVNQAGYIQFGFMEFKQAVKEKYLAQEEKKQFYMKRLINYFEEKLRQVDEMPDVSVAKERPVAELPWLWLDLGDMAGLVRCLSHSAVFTLLERHSVFDLVTMWQQTDYTGTQIADILLKAFDNKVAQLYVDLEDKGILRDVESPGLQLEPFLKAVDRFLSESGFHEARERVILRHMKVLTEGLDQGVVKSRDVVEERLYYCKYRLACLKCDMYKQQEEGIALHQELQQHIESQPSCTEEMLTRLGFAYNGIACGYLQLGDYEKVVEYCQKSIDCHVRTSAPMALSHIAASYSNMGIALMERGECEAALPCFEKSIERYEEFHFGEMPPVIGEILTNKGICLRRLGRIEEAKRVYKKSLKVKVCALGRTHQVVAMAYMNIGSLELLRENFEKAKHYFKQCLEIYEVLEQTWTNVNYVKAWENVFGAELSLGHFEEVEQKFMEILDWRVEDNSMDACLHTVFKDMGKYYIREGNFEAAYKTIYALLNSRHNKEEMLYLFMDITLQNLPPSYRENIPKEFTLAYSVEKFPGNVQLLKNLVERYLAPAGDEDEIARVINQHHSYTDMAHDVYIVTLPWCQNGDEIIENCQQRIIQEGLLKYPDNLDLHLYLAKSILRQGRSDLALPHAQKVAELQLNNDALIFFTAHTAALAGEMDVCQKYCQHLLNTCKDQTLIEKTNQLLKLIKSTDERKDGDSQGMQEEDSSL